MTSAMRKTGGFLMTIVMGALFSSVCARASTVLYSTLGPNSEYDSTQGWLLGNFFGDDQVMAMQFTLGAGATVGDAVLALGDGFPVSVYIESDTSGLPGSIITTLSQVGQIPSSGGLVTFNCGLLCTLGPGSYWLVALAPDSMQSWEWAYQDATGNITYNQIGSPTGPWHSSYDGNLGGFRIDSGSSIPEPNSLVLLGFGMLGVAALVRRRVKS